MYGYQVKINGLPQTVWACDTTVTDYQWKNNNRSHMIEISLSKAQSRTICIHNREYHLGDGYTLSCVIGDTDISSFSPPDTQVSITSVAVAFPELSAIGKELTQADAQDQSAFLLPAFQQPLSTEEIVLFQTLLHKYIKYNAESTAAGQASCLSALFELLASIDAMTRRCFLVPEENMSHYYIKKTNTMIEKRYHEKLSQTAIAAELGVSAGYLSALYKQTTGMTFSDYLLQVRMTHAQELLQNPNLPTSRIAQMTGFGEESYFRKKFRQYFGMSVREYRCIKNSLTLFHKKPQRPHD